MSLISLRDKLIDVFLALKTVFNKLLEELLRIYPLQAVIAVTLQVQFGFDGSP